MGASSMASVLAPAPALAELAVSSVRVNPEEDHGHSSPACSEEPEPVLYRRCRLAVLEVLVTHQHMAHRFDCHSSTVYLLPLINTAAF